MKTFIINASIIYLFSLSANASNAVWQFRAKLGGPSPFKCGETLQIENDGTTFKIVTTDSQIFYDVDQGRQCHPANSGSILGGMNCFENTVIDSNDSWSLVNRTCSTPFGSVKCHPESISYQVKIDWIKNTLTTSMQTGWSNDPSPIFICEYTGERTF